MWNHFTSTSLGLFTYLSVKFTDNSSDMVSLKYKFKLTSRVSKNTLRYLNIFIIYREITKNFRRFVLSQMPLSRRLQ
jgi:hypothetical protein